MTSPAHTLVELRIQKYPDTCGRGLRFPSCDVAGCNWQRTIGEYQARLRWIADVHVLKFAQNANRIAQFSTVWVESSHFRTLTIADDRRLGWDVELSSTSQASRRSMLGTDYVSAINVHICRSVVSRRAGGYTPGMSAAYENQASTICGYYNH